MSPINRLRLLALSEREFKRIAIETTAAPVRGKFRGMKMKVEQFDVGWDRKRGAAARLTGVLLREDDAALERRVCENTQSASTYRDAACWLQREATYLRKMARLQELAGKRLTAVLSRCMSSDQAAQ